MFIWRILFFAKMLICSIGVLQINFKWNNDYIFQEDGKFEDLRFVDFQLSRVGSVAHDLGYLFFSGVKKEIFDNFEDYLKIYHNSFSNTLRSYDLDPVEIFTFEDLKNEFKKYYLYGFVLGLIIWPNKLSDSYQTKSAVELSEESKSPPSIYIDALKNNDIKEICLNIVKFLYSSDLL